MTTTVGFTTVEAFEAKLKKLAANHNLVMNAADSVVALRRLRSAYTIVLGRLIARGVSRATADMWNRGEEYQLDIATFWFGCDSGWLRENSDEQHWLKVFKREEELATVTLFDSDFEQLPADDDVPVRVWNVEEDS